MPGRQENGRKREVETGEGEKVSVFFKEQNPGGLLAARGESQFPHSDVDDSGARDVMARHR